MRLGRIVAVTGAAILLLLSVVPAALAYQGQVVTQVTVTGPAAFTCNEPFTVTATALDSNGQPVEGQAVAWSIGAGLQTGDGITPATSTTNASGKATATVTLACVVADRTIVATASSTNGEVVLGGGQIVLSETATPNAATPSPGTTTAAGVTSPPTAASTGSTGSNSSSFPLWVFILSGLLILLIIVVFLTLRFDLLRR
jgi:hypothetical protein